jgi:hypothetical protein
MFKATIAGTVEDIIAATPTPVVVALWSIKAAALSAHIQCATV